MFPQGECIQCSSAVPSSSSPFFAPVLSQYSLHRVQSRRTCSLVGTQASWEPARGQPCQGAAEVCAQERRLNPAPEGKGIFGSQWGCMLPDAVGSWAFPAEACRRRFRKHMEPQLPAKPSKPWDGLLTGGRAGNCKCKGSLKGGTCLWYIQGKEGDQKP